ncbi:acyl-CoA thioesterase [Bacterioplanoides pacificum]|uniref:Acyl-CoA thioesterase n=1 Tax=Bacterioplanoides pacificum TaxID=1171596 RepID=A0ABV7VQP1_9GAMM
MSAQLNNLDFYLQQVRQQPQFRLDASWGQGRTTFGGMSAALILTRLQQQTPQAGQLRSLNIAFCGPLLTEQDCHIHSQEIRSGKSTSHWQGQLLQDSKVTTLVNACFGQGRDSDIRVNPEPMEVLQPQDGKQLPYIAGLTPEFVQHIDFIYHQGQFPFTNSPLNHIRGLMRFADHPQQLGNEHLVALIDAWPPTVLQKLKAPAPCASVTWSLELVNPIAQLARPIGGDEYLYYEAEIRQAHDGYAHTEARIATLDGTLLALSRQLIAVYDKR